MVKNKLGDNFDSIFDDLLEGGESGEITALKLSELEPNRAQPRKKFDTEKLNTLADSLLQHGMIQPIAVRPLESGGYQIIAGERRYRAAKIAGLREVPVRILDISNETAAQLALIENLQREDLNPIEEAAGYRDLIDIYNMTQDDVAKIVGKSRPSVTNAMRLLVLPEKLREYAADGVLSRGHCKVLLALADNTAAMLSLGERAVQEGLSVRVLERLVTAAASDTKAPPRKAEPRHKNTYYAEAEVALSAALGGKAVRITESKGKCSLTIDFTDENDLRGIIEAGFAGNG